MLLNVTAVGATAEGFISIRPGDATGAPKTSNLNFSVNETSPNSVQVALPTTGANAGTDRHHLRRPRYRRSDNGCVDRCHGVLRPWRRRRYRSCRSCRSCRSRPVSWRRCLDPRPTGPAGPASRPATRASRIATPSDPGRSIAIGSGDAAWNGRMVVWPSVGHGESEPVRHSHEQVVYGNEVDFCLTPLT